MSQIEQLGYEEREFTDEDTTTRLRYPFNVDQGNTIVSRRTIYEAVPKNADSTKVSDVRTIKLAPLVDHSQTLPPVARVAVRKLKEDGIVKIGRLERIEGSENKPIVYASKVVSRLHAEIVLWDGQWYVRDVGSSSGTFVNNERLSSPSLESPLRRVTTGDVIRFGVDFRGGQEPQFRAIRVRVELDGGKNQQPVEFQRNQFSKLTEMINAAGVSKVETCAFCLEEMAPFNSLFVAPCCHMWHYKCIRTTVVANYPYFECPLCRKTFDLEDASEDDDDDDDEEDDNASETS